MYITIRLEEGRWCSVAWGRRTGRSCWPQCSQGHSLTGESDRGGAGGAAAGAGEGRQHAGPGKRRIVAGRTPSSLCRAHRDDVQYKTR